MPKLSADDYPHARSAWTLIANYLATVSEKKTTGVNVLIHGRPGSGKTEFVRALARERRLNLCDVVVEDAEGEALTASRRLGAYQLAQRALANAGGHAILFDEIEDVFPITRHPWGFMISNGESAGKALMNQVLEENPVPTFWLSNHIEQIAPAYLRRFDLIIEMPEPTRVVRRNLLVRYLKGIPVSEHWLDSMAENRGLTPAGIERAAKVVRALTPANTQEAELHFERILRSSQEAMGQGWTPPASSSAPIPYRLGYLNPDRNLSGVVEGLKWRGQGRLCLYGPPGTGKSAFGRHVAEEMDRPLLVKRASDLLSMWVGGSEQNIAQMFQEAARESAVLLLDEADSFLQERGRAQHSWEVTQVNELLTQMEAFEGVFVASTNLMDSLDAASLRRFDFKVRFDYLTAKQREEMFADALPVLGITGKTIPENVRERLRSLSTLAPGDFAVAIRQSRLSRNPFTQEELLAILVTECAIKDRGKTRPIGFTGQI